MVYGHTDTYSSLEGVITAIHESSACQVLERLGSSNIHYVKPTWTPVEIGRNPGYFSGFGADLSSDLNSNDRNVPSEATMDQKSDPRKIDYAPSMDESFELVTADLPVKESAVEESHYNNEYFVITEPAVDDAPREEPSKERFCDTAAIDEPVEETKDEPALYASDPDFNYPFITPLSKKRKKSRKIVSPWDIESQPIEDPPAAVAVEESAECAASDPEPVAEEPPRETYHEASVVEDCLDMPTSPQTIFDTIPEAVPDEPQFKAPIEEALAAKSKKSKKGKFKKGKKGRKALSSICSNAPALDEASPAVNESPIAVDEAPTVVYQSLEAAAPAADWEASIPESVPATPEDDSPSPQEPE